MIVFCSELIRMIYEHAEKEYPNECCGILLGERDSDGNRIVKAVYKADNAAEEKRTRFVIPTDEILDAESAAAENNDEIVGFYHSHTDCEAVASQEDSSYAIPGISYPIVSVKNGQVKELFSWEKPWISKQESLVKEIIRIKG